MTLTKEQKIKLSELFNNTMLVIDSTIEAFTENQTTSDFHDKISDYITIDCKIHTFLCDLHNELNGEKI